MSSHALGALQEFYSDRDTRARQFEELKAAAEEREAAGREKEAALVYPLSMEMFGEDWGKSQFWVRSFWCSWPGWIESMCILGARGVCEERDCVCDKKRAY